MTEGGPSRPGAESDRPAQHERTSQFLLGGFERRVLPPLARALPDWVLPDHLTLLGLLASTGIAAAYLLSNRNEDWLWVASLLLIVQWFGDSLDGTLARTRRIERPRYGYYLDHLTDAYSTIAIGLGLGLSPYMLLAVGFAIVIAYLVSRSTCTWRRTCSGSSASATGSSARPRCGFFSWA